MRHDCLTDQQYKEYVKSDHMLNYIFENKEEVLNQFKSMDTDEQWEYIAFLDAYLEQVDFVLNNQLTSCGDTDYGILTTLDIAWDEKQYIRPIRDFMAEVLVPAIN